MQASSISCGTDFSIQFYWQDIYYYVNKDAVNNSVIIKLSTHVVTASRYIGVDSLEYTM